MIPKTLKNHKEIISIIFTNARGMMSKQNELKIICFNRKTKYYCIFRNMDNYVGQPLLTALTTPGYKLFTINRLHKTGGGVLIYVDNCIGVVNVDQVQQMQVLTIFCASIQPIETKMSSLPVSYLDLRSRRKNMTQLYTMKLDQL